MVRIEVKEYTNSIPEIRMVPMRHAYNLGKHGGYHSLKIINEWGAIHYEYRGGRSIKQLC